MYDWRKEHCDRCVTSKDQCINCKDNPIYADYPKQSKFAAYMPVCPRGYSDCIYDPAYIKFNYSEWYKELYGNMTPAEAILVPDGCMEKCKEDPDMDCCCYDDEDK